MKKRNYGLIFISTALGCCSLIFFGLFLSFWATTQTYKTQLENTYMKCFYEMVGNVNNLEVDMSKLVATTSIDSQRQLLGGIYESCMLGVSNINLLPLNGHQLSNINKLLNNTGGLTYSLLLANYDGETITESDFLQINELHTKVKEIQYDLNDYVSKLKFDYSILNDVEFTNVESSDFSAGLINTESSHSSVPSLIYDGPFSDSVLYREIKGLQDRVYSLEEVEEKLHDLFTGFAIYYMGDTNGKFQTYNFDVKGDIDLYVSVTKQGGFLLTINAYGAGQGDKLNVTQGIEFAHAFAKDVGIDNMHSVWHQKTGNILYVNMAPIIDHVIYYPDLIKVKIDLSLGLVVGWEATGYATNHIDRVFTSSIGLMDATALINPLLTIEERNLCIIPDKYVGELSAYEFICSWKEYTYYIYIDSNSGKEANILRVINTTNGDLLM